MSRRDIRSLIIVWLWVGSVITLSLSSCTLLPCCRLPLINTSQPALQPAPVNSLITLQVHDASARDTFFWISDQMGLMLSMSSQSESQLGRVSLDIKRVKSEIVLNDLCYSLGCSWQVRDGALVVQSAKVDR